MVTRHKNFFYVALAGMAVAVAVLLSWYTLEVRERVLIDNVTESTGRGIEALIKKDIEGRVTLLSGLARRWQEPGGLSRVGWETAVRNIFKAQSGYEAIAWVDTSMHVRWVLLQDGREPTVNFDLRTRPSAFVAAQAAQDRNTVAFSNPLVSLGGGRGFGIYIPVYLLTADGLQFDGLMGSVLLVKPMLEALLPKDVIAQQFVSLSINGQALFSSAPESPVTDQRWTKQSSFELYGLEWQLLVAPKQEFISQTHDRLSKIMLALGLLLTSLAALTTYFMLVSRQRAKLVTANARRLDRFFKNLPGMTYRCPNYHPWPMEFVSDGCEALWGYSPKELETQQVVWGELIHPDDQVRVVREVNDATDKQERFDLEYRIQTRTGEERWVWDRGIMIPGSDVEETVLEGFITDITERKNALLALEEERAYSNAIVDTAVDAIITTDASGCIETFNHSAEKIFGYVYEDVRGKNARMLMPEPYRTEHDNYLARYLSTGEARVIGNDREASGQRRDGTTFPIQISISELNGQSRRSFVSLIRDVSQQRLAEQVAIQQREQLAHAGRLNMLGEMATGIAHEINQPLTAISLFAQAGKRLFAQGHHDELPAVFDKLSQHAQRAGAVIERVQKLGRKHASTMELVECNALVEEIVKLAESEAHIRDISIKVETNGPPFMVSADPVQIQQIALNLLRNGMESMSDVECRNGRIIKIGTELRSDGYIEIYVTDSGSGVSTEASLTLFEPFSTSKAQGMGMGLSISRSLTASHGGQLNYRNNELNGVTFFFTLPPAQQGDKDG